jgi:hypothetical protein
MIVGTAKDFQALSSLGGRQEREQEMKFTT